VHRYIIKQPYLCAWVRFLPPVEAKAYPLTAGRRLRLKGLSPARPVARGNRTLGNMRENGVRILAPLLFAASLLAESVQAQSLSQQDLDLSCAIAGATLGDFKSRVFGVGPQIGYVSSRRYAGLPELEGLQGIRCRASCRRLERMAHFRNLPFRQRGCASPADGDEVADLDVLVHKRTLSQDLRLADPVLTDGRPFALGGADFYNFYFF
jgi:hypothetical protein